MGDRVCIMDHGEVAQIGTPMEVYLNPANTFVAAFLGNPPMNLMPATAAEGALRTGTGQAPIAGLSPGRRVTLGVRPEDLAVTDDPARALVSGRVTQVEALGAETLIHVATGDEKPVILRSGRAAQARLDETLHLAADPAALRLFDIETGRAISREM